MAERGADLRNDLAKARDEWMLSVEGRNCSEPLPINTFYLRNRLESAFVAGWNAAAKKAKR